MRERGFGGGLGRWAAEAVETEVKYEGFIKRQEGQVAKVAGKMNKKIPAGIDYAAITTLRMEAREKLAKMQPSTVGQASRIRRSHAGGRVESARAPRGGRAEGERGE